ncbi:MAG TPA: HD domain-containing phosphohydrolase [Solirubrobacteraceae bacterium]|nr:HD domain-containing phosphohydrolase [Solirubrobacteraceae bacterium]
MLERQGMSTRIAATRAECERALAEPARDLIVVDSPDDGTSDFGGCLEGLEADTATVLLGEPLGEPLGVAARAVAHESSTYLGKPFSAEQLAVKVLQALRRRAEDVLVKQGPSRPEAGQQGIIGCLIRAGRFHDDETAEHVERVSRAAALIAREMGWDHEECASLRAASALHDVGKIGIPDHILQKPRRLTKAERTTIEGHALIGHEILAGSGIEILDMASSIAATHHEWMDGTGYPARLAGEDIPLAGRITAVADVFDALTHPRVYRTAFEVPVALDMLERDTDTQFDRAVVAAFRAVLPEIEQVRELYREPPSPWSHTAARADRPLRMLIVEDHAAMAGALATMLRGEGIEIAGVASNIAEARRMIAQRDADVITLDISLQKESGLELIAQAHARGLRVLVYSGGVSPQFPPGTDAPDGTASKLGTKAELLTAIRLVAGGHGPVDSRLAAPAAGDHLLTPREREIVGLLSGGESGEEIAEHLFLSPHTVRTHIRNATNRMGARTRSHLVMLAAGSGEIPLGHAGSSG